MKAKGKSQPPGDTGEPDETGEPDAPERDDLARARELLERTMRFLTRCTEDPEAAVKAEDPRELIRGLRDLATPPPPAVEDEPEVQELPSIPLRKRRRSA